MNQFAISYSFKVFQCGYRSKFKICAKDDKPCPFHGNAVIRKCMKHKA